MGKKHHDVCLGDDFVGITLKMQTTKTKINKWTIPKQKAFS